MINISALATAMASVESSRPKAEPLIPTHVTVWLKGGPLDGWLRKLEYTEKIVVFTSDSGAHEYVRGEVTKAYTVYRHLTPDLKEQLLFESKLRAMAASMDESEIFFNWTATFPNYNLEHNDKMRALGFKWDKRCKQWWLVGSMDTDGEDITHAQKYVEKNGGVFECAEIREN